MLTLLINMAVVYDLLSCGESELGSVLRSKLNESVPEEDMESFVFGSGAGNNHSQPRYILPNVFSLIQSATGNRALGPSRCA